MFAKIRSEQQINFLKLSYHLFSRMRKQCSTTANKRVKLILNNFEFLLKLYLTFVKKPTMNAFGVNFHPQQKG